MYKHVLIATDGSELADKAVATGLRLAQALKSKVTVVTVTEPWSAIVTEGFPYAEYEQAAAEAAARILARATELATQMDVACTTVHAKDQYAADGIVDTANANECDLIVMASHGRRGLNRLLLGSEAARVVTHSTLPVLICR